MESVNIPSERSKTRGAPFREAPRLRKWEKSFQKRMGFDPLLWPWLAVPAAAWASALPGRQLEAASHIKGTKGFGWGWGKGGGEGANDLSEGGDDEVARRYI